MRLRELDIFLLELKKKGELEEFLKALKYPKVIPVLKSLALSSDSYISNYELRELVIDRAKIISLVDICD